MAAANTLPRGFRAASPADVREWAAENGLDAGGSRGRLPKATVDAFNAAHAKGKGRAKYVPGYNAGKVTVTQRGPKGGVIRTATEHPNVIRTAAALAGVQVASRGRLSEAAIDAYFASLDS